MSFFGTLASGGFDWKKDHGEPQNKKQLFRCVVWENFFSLTGINLLYLLFWLPAVFWSVISLSMASGSLNAEDLTMVFPYVSSWLLGMIPCLLIAGPARAGMARVMRFWAEEKTGGTFTNFWKGMKGNWKQALLASLLQGVLLVALWYGALGLLNNAENAGAFRIVYAVASILIGLFLLSLQLLYPLMVTYDLPFKAQLKNALLLTALRLFKCLALRLALWSVPLLFGLLFAFIPSLAMKLMLVPALYYLFCGGTLSMLATGIFTKYLREKHLEK